MQKVNSKPFSSLIICKSSGASGGSAPWTPTRALPWTHWGPYSAPQTPSCLGNDLRSLRACRGHAPSASQEYFKPRNPPSNFLDPPLVIAIITLITMTGSCCMYLLIICQKFYDTNSSLTYFTCLINFTLVHTLIREIP